MALTYTTTKSTLDEIANAIRTAENRLERARVQLETAEASLAAMPTKYGDFVTELDAEALAQANDLWDQAKAQKDAMVADFNALRTRAEDLLAAYDSVV